LLQAICGIRSERLLIDQLDYILLFSWFVGLNFDDPVCHSNKVINHQGWFLNEGLMPKFLELLQVALVVKPLLSPEHFSEDGT
jgi:hypothetical protein